MGTEQFLAADRDRFPLKVRRLERLSVRMSRGAGHMCAGSSESVGICSTGKDANSLAGAVGIKAEATLAQRAKVAEAKPSERSLSGVKRA